MFWNTLNLKSLVCHQFHSTNLCSFPPLAGSSSSCSNSSSNPQQPASVAQQPASVVAQTTASSNRVKVEQQPNNTSQQQQSSSQQQQSSSSKVKSPPTTYQQQPSSSYQQQPTTSQQQAGYNPSNFPPKSPRVPPPHHHYLLGPEQLFKYTAVTSSLDTPSSGGYYATTTGSGDPMLSSQLGGYLPMDFTQTSRVGGFPSTARTHSQGESPMAGVQVQSPVPSSWQRAPGWRHYHNDDVILYCLLFFPFSQQNSTPAKHKMFVRFFLFFFLFFRRKLQNWKCFFPLWCDLFLSADKLKSKLVSYYLLFRGLFSSNNDPKPREKCNWLVVTNLSPYFQVSWK